jgi:hypothetical protein
LRARVVVCGHADRRSLVARPAQLLPVVHELLERLDAHLKAEEFYSGAWLRRAPRRVRLLRTDGGARRLDRHRHGPAERRARGARLATHEVATPHAAVAAAAAAVFTRSHRQHARQQP